ncbi:MAG TPA: hypothetical protein VGK22_08725 [Candidatus Angelobacter sp.]|jgi:hypothetical protein
MMNRAARLALFALISLATGLAQTANTEQPSQNATQTPSTAAGVGQVAAGTEIHATLDTPLSSKTSKPGDRFTATIADEVRGPDNGALVIPGGARVEGEVAEPDDNKAIASLHGKGTLSLRFRDVVLPNGQTLPLMATLISVHDTSTHGASVRNSNKNINPSAQDNGGATPIAGLTFGGPVKGIAIGARAGGGYVVSTKGKDVNLPAQTGMVIRLDQSVSWNGTSAAIR